MDDLQNNFSTRWVAHAVNNVEDELWLQVLTREKPINNQRKFHFTVKMSPSIWNNMM